MKKMICMLSFLLLSAAASQAEENIAHEPGKWEKAGTEISEAAHAVSDATVDSSKKGWKATRETSAKAWDATKEGSSEAWDSTKSKSHDMWEKGKAKVHEATAPGDAPVEHD